MSTNAYSVDDDGRDSHKKEVAALAVEPVIFIDKETMPKPEKEITPAASSITIDEVCSVVQGEINCTQADLSHQAQTELATLVATDSCTRLCLELPLFVA